MLLPTSLRLPFLPTVILGLGLLLRPGAECAALGAEGHALVPERHRALLDSHCKSCHGPDKQKGKFRVDDLPLEITSLETAERWQKILNQMNSGEMPPEDEKQPPKTGKTDFLDDLSNLMVVARRNLGDQKGVITMRRFNRREYKNTLREMLGVEINVSELPADSGTGSFDTVGSNLFMSANQFEQYQALGREALEETFLRLTNAPVEKKLHWEAEETLKDISKAYTDAQDALQRAELWAQAVDEAAARPENATAVAEIRKAAKDDATFRRSWAKINGAPPPEDFGFKTVENNADKANGALQFKTKAGLGYMRPFHEYYLSLPALDTGAYLTVGQWNGSLTQLIPHAWPPGEYVVRARVGATPDAPPERRFLDFGIDPRGGPVLHTFEITASLDAPQIIEIPLTLTRKHTANADRTLFLREKGTMDHYLQTRSVFDKAKNANGVGPTVALWIDWIEIERKPTPAAPVPPAIAALGIPFDDKSPPPQPAELRSALEGFACTAFRGLPPPPSYLDRLVAIYETRRKSGEKHGPALRDTLAIILASPKFLYLAEPNPDEKRRALSPLELATRLSYFLWSAPPDPGLLQLASAGTLSNPEVLAAQTARLLEDPRAESFIHSFLYQWLVLDRLDFFEVNRTLFPNFDDATRLAAKTEVYQTFTHLFRQNSSLGDLLKSDYVIVNGLLARFYGLEGVSGDAFRKVALPKDSPRGGFLGMAAINLMGGNGEVTSPVNRGAWVLRKLLNEPPPPAPANIPQIARLAGKVLTTRERLSAHQEDAQCTSCHRKIDPIGFGLENFDAIGQWRTQDSYQLLDEKGKPLPKTKKVWDINASSAFHKGPSFGDYFAMRDLIASQPGAFARGFSKALIEYALGRPFGFSDQLLLEDILQKAAPTNFAIRDVLQLLVASREFHSK